MLGDGVDGFGLFGGGVGPVGAAVWVVGGVGGVGLVAAAVRPCQVETEAVDTDLGDPYRSESMIIRSAIRWPVFTELPHPAVSM